MSTHVDDVPTDVFQQCICPWLTPRELLQCAAVSRTWHSRARANRAWRAHKDRLVRYLPELQVVFDAHPTPGYWYVYATWLINKRTFYAQLIGDHIGGIRCGDPASSVAVALTKTYLRTSFRCGAIRQILQDTRNGRQFSVVFCAKDLDYPEEWLTLEFREGVDDHPQNSRGVSVVTTYSGNFIPNYALVVYQSFLERARRNAFFNRSARDTAPLPPPMYEFVERYSALNVDANP